MAEFDNYRRRTRKELAVAQQTGKSDVLLAFLDVMDDFDRALLHLGEASDAVVEGLRLIRQRFNDVLISNGVAAFDSEGQPFDPMIHEAMSVIAAPAVGIVKTLDDNKCNYAVGRNRLRLDWFQ